MNFSTHTPSFLNPIGKSTMKTKVIFLSVTIFTCSILSSCRGNSLLPATTELKRYDLTTFIKYDKVQDKILTNIANCHGNFVYHQTTDKYGRITTANIVDNHSKIHITIEENKSLLNEVTIRILYTPYFPDFNMKNIPMWITDISDRCY